MDKIIRIKLDAAQANRGVAQLDNNMRRAGKATDALQTSLSRVASAVAAALSARQIIAYADAYTNLQNKLKIVTRDSENLAAVSSELLRISNESRSSLASSADLYSKLARSTEELGISQARLLKITDTINKSFAASGSTAEQAAGAIIQLGQGLAAGALRGDEFNSVAEGAPGILRAVAVETGKTIGELREFAAQGGITAELLINSIENYSDVVNEEFGKTSRTFSQSLTVANNNLTDFVGRSNAVQSSLRGLGNALVAITGSLDELDKFGTALAAGFTKIAISAEGQFRLLGEGIELALTLPFFEARNAAIDFITFLVDIGEPVRNALGFGGVFDNFTTNLAKNKRDVLAEYKQITDGIKAETESALNQADDIYADIFASIGATSVDAIETVSAVNGQVKEIVVTFEQLKKVSSGIDSLFSGSFNLFGDDSKKTNQSDEQQARINARIAALRQETATIASELQLQRQVFDQTLIEEEAAIQASADRKLQQAITNRDLIIQEQGVTDTQRLEAAFLFEQQKSLIEQEAEQSRLQLARDQMLERMQIEQQTRDAYLDTASTALGALTNLLGGSKKAGKALKLVQAGVNAFQVFAASQTAAALILATPPGPVLNPALGPLAASVIAKGKISAAAILAGAAADTFSGSGGGISSFSGGAAASSTPPTTPQAAAQVNSFELVGIQGLIDQLRDSSGVVTTGFVADILEKIPGVQRLSGEG